MIVVMVVNIIHQIQDVQIVILQWKDLSGHGNDWTAAGTHKGTYFQYSSTSASRGASSDWLMTTDCTIDLWWYPASGGINTGCCATIFGRYWFRFFQIRF